MEKALITGANGFVGANLVRAVLGRGAAVRVFVREKSDRRVLDGLDIETAHGDLRDKESLKRALDGCDTLFHCGAAYSMWRRDRDWIYATNVDGTRNALEAAEEQGIGNIVYTSSVAAISKKPGLTPGDEDYQVDPDRIISYYKHSKHLAEKEAMKIAARGVPVKIVNPSAPMGPYDAKPTPTGRIIVDFLNRKVPCYLDTGLNIIAVEDCCEGHLRALDKARPGERYILGGSNVTLKQIFEMLSELTGIPAPKRKIPRSVAMLVGYTCEAWSAVAGKPPAVPVDGVKMARDYLFFDSSKAIRELGLPQTPPEVALERAARWFIDNGYVRRDVTIRKAGVPEE